MSALAYYNEIDPHAAQWLRNLIEAGHIAPGTVDTRSIVDVRPADLAGYAQCHFFAGIAGWSLALRLAGVPDDLPVWTGSCPCQPFSAAGQRRGFADDRHLWPAWFDLIRECRPVLLFGEQVASKDGLGWLDAVLADLEGAGYACRAADLCAAGVGAPHIRQRLWFVAYAGRERCDGQPARLWQPETRGWIQADRSEAARGGETGGVGDAERIGLRGEGRGSNDGAPGGVPHSDRQREWLRSHPGTAGSPSLGVAHADGRNARAEGLQRGGEHGLVAEDGGPVPHRWPGAAHGSWDDADWLRCRDGRWRPVEPGTFPLASGLPGRVGRLRAYGNAIVPQVAAAFISASLDALSAARPAAGRLLDGVTHDGMPVLAGGAA